MLAPWEESYDQHNRQHIKHIDSILNRHHFANKGPYSQSCGFSSSHVWIKSWTIRRLSAKELMPLFCFVFELMPLNCGAGENS